MRILYGLLISLALLPSLGKAEDLLTIYQFAQENDPTIQAAKAAQLAAKEAFPQARSLFLPTINIAVNSTQYIKNYGAGQASVANQTIPLTTSKFRYQQNTYALTLSQPVFYYQQWVQLGKAESEIKQANAIYAVAEQDLIVRTIQRYFAVLRALDTLKFAVAQRTAFLKILEQTKQRFRAGVINTVTDLQIAQARYDSSIAQEIAARNNIVVQKKQLEEITNKKVEKLVLLQDNVQFTAPDPKDPDAWVNKAIEQNLDLQAAHYQVESSRADIKLSTANHFPILNIDGSIGHATGTKDIMAIPKNNNAYIGLQVAMPLFNGGSVLSKTRQSRHIYEQLCKQKESLYRQIESQTSEAYLNVLTQISQIQALKQAVVSNQSAWEATNAAFKAGIRTIVDVLNAQSDLIKVEQDYANARYDYILQSLQLKRVAGNLSPYDIVQINNWLKVK